MKKAGIIVLVFSFISAAAQTQPNQSRNSTTPHQPSERERQEEMLRRKRDLDERSRALRALENEAHRTREYPEAAAKKIEAIYRNPTEKELKALAPHPEDLAKYSTFLDKKRTGLVRLVPDAGCGDETMVVAATETCLKYPMPGNGSSYSFRNANYRVTRLSDLKFADGHFDTSGINQIGILVDIGNIELEQVSPGTKGMEFLNSFLPASDVAEAQRFDEQLLAGIERDGYRYSKRVRAAEGRTFAVRSVAYRGTFVRSMNGLAYDEMAFDKRFDITVAFRIIRRHDDGSVTVLWKELARHESPRLKLKSKDKQNNGNE